MIPAVQPEIWPLLHQLPSGVLLWAGLTLVMWKVVRCWPGQRHRELFHRQAPWVQRYITGELAVWETLLVGGGVGLLLLFWLELTDWVPRYPWGLVLEVLWGDLLGLALFNAGRKSGLRGLRALLVAAISSGAWIGVLWRGVTSWWGE